ncbi:MAG: serine hydrolase, partial [Flavobacteriales bacterium]
MVRNLIFLLVFCASLVSCAQGELTPSEKFANEMDSRVPQLLHDFNVPGAAIAVIKNGEVILQKGYGYSNLENEVKVDVQTGFNIASISKTLTAWGVMKLVHEGKIDLNSPAEMYLTRWHLPESEFNSDEVTIRRLLSHTAGLSLHGYPGWTSSDVLPSIEESLNGKNNGAEAVEIVMEPGLKYQYSGGGYTMLQLIIEEVSGQKFEDYMQEMILDPLGMTNSSYKIDDEILAASSAEYNDFGEEIDFELFTAQAAAGLHTTIEDFTRFALASLYRNKSNLKDNPILPGDLVQLMMEAVPAKTGDFGYGLGYEVDTNEALFGLKGHNGDNTGWHALFRVDPVSNDGFVVFTNGGPGYHIVNGLLCEWVTWNTGESPWEGCKMKLPISGTLKQHIDEKGLGEVASTYARLKKERPDDYNFSEGQLNELGYFYVGKKELDKAIVIFKLNTEAFPYAWNAFDSYGEALLANGEREKAIENYKMSI